MEFAVFNTSATLQLSIQRSIDPPGSLSIYPQTLAGLCLLNNSTPGNRPARVVGLGVHPISCASEPAGVGVVAPQGTATTVEAVAATAIAHKRVAEDRCCDIEAADWQKAQ